MSPGGVEVAEQSGVPVIAGFALFLQVVPLCFDVIGYARFDGCLGPAIRVGGAQRTSLRDGDHVGESGRIAIHGRRGREDNVGDIMRGHGFEQTDGAIDIGMVVFERDLRRLSDRLRRPVSQNLSMLIETAVTPLNFTIPSRQRSGSRYQYPDALEKPCPRRRPP